MQNNFKWLTSYEVIDINIDVVTREGEPHLILDIDKLEGAVERPYNACAFGGEGDVLSLGVNYMVSIAEAHAFIQGNKRTGFIAGRSFMLNHGYDIAVPDTKFTADLFIQVIDKKVDISAFQTHLELHTVPYD